MSARFTVTRKIIAGYLVFAFFGTVALAYALHSLHAQTRRAEQLVKRDIRSLELARDLGQNLLAQERLEQQFLLLRDAALLEMLGQRQAEFASDWAALAVAAPENLTSFEPLAINCEAGGTQQLRFLTEGDLGAAQKFAATSLVPCRSGLTDELEAFAAGKTTVIETTLRDLPAESDRSFRIALLLVYLGLLCSTPVAIVVIFGIYRSLGELTRATKQVAAGSFDYRIDISSQDEFGELAREFILMGRKLDELEKLHLDANPLTHLPGNLAIDRELDRRIRQGQPFAHMYIDLDHFKAYGDRYGYQAGSSVLTEVADLIRCTVARWGDSTDLVGHIGGDDYIVLTDPERVEAMARDLIVAFDRKVPDFYSPEDRQAGHFVASDRFGVERKFALLSMSIAIILSDNLEFSSQQAFSRECAKMKEYLKTLPGSNYLINRRRKI
jgi:GGDEF domain-containing protein/CHASE3 domain sensor protein